MKHLAAILLLGLAKVGAVPLISEIMFHPPHASGKEDTREEWIEIYNPGPASFNLAGWSLGGVSFTFPNVTLEAHDYLVIAADLPTFRTLHPGVPNVVGGWDGRLSNRGESISLIDHTGKLMDRVAYADGGDWAERRPGPNDLGHRGWIWVNPADGEGRSYELCNLRFRNDSGQNWAASGIDGGTPGARNSKLIVNLPPLIEEVSHHPAVPRSDDLVLIRARLTDDISRARGVVHHRMSTLNPGAFEETPMRDDGMGGDERAGDGIHTALLPARPDGTVVEFFVEAFDPVQSRTWPGPTSDDGAQQANLLYQVDNEAHDGGVPFYRLILTAAENEEYLDISFDTGERNTNARFNTTFVAQVGDQFTTIYRCGVRLRGSGTRARYPRNLKLELPTTEKWQGYDELNLNSQFTYNQLLGSLFYREAGLPAYEAKAVEVRMNGIDHTSPENSTVSTPFNHHFGMYVHNEPINSQFVGEHFPLEDDGNLYRMAGTGSGWEFFPGSQDLAKDYASAGWEKENNTAVGDWSDLHRFIGTMTTASGPDYLTRIETVMDLDSWLRTLAVSTILTNGENSLFTGRDDDYALFRGGDGRFKLIPHDLDTILGQGDSSRIEAGDLPHTILDFVERGESFRQLEPLFDRPEIKRRYYQILRELLAGPFEETRANRLIDNALTWTPPVTARTAKAFLAARRADILKVIDRPLTGTVNLPTLGGFPRSTDGEASLEGTFNVTGASAVLVNGSPATLDLNTGAWSLRVTNLHPGVNRLVLEETDQHGVVLSKGFLDVFHDDGDTSTLEADVQAELVLDAASGPWVVTNPINVLPGATLTIEAGTSLFFESGAGITVHPDGTLRCEGTPYERIRLTRQPGTLGTWQGLNISAPAGESSLTDNLIAHTDLEHGDSQGECILLRRSRLTLEGVSWNHSRETVLELTSPQLEIRDCVFPSTPGAEVIHGATLTGDDYLILRRNYFVPSSGYTDIIDFTGGRRPGPIFTAYDNVFTGSTDDCIDLDNCDAHLEGNIFLNVHLDNPRETTSNAIATDDDSHLTVVRNFFFDVDHALLLKNGADCIFEHNTVVRAGIAAINLDEPLRPGFLPGERIEMDSNIFLECAEIFAHATSTPPEPDPVIIGHRNILPAAYHEIGDGNLDLDPFLSNLEAGPWPDKSSWALLPGSPAIGTGKNGLDRGALVPRGASATGLPNSITALTSATLHVDGPGVTGFRWRLVTDGAAGPWSEELPLDANVSLEDLPVGRHHVDLLSRDSAGLWQGPLEFTSSRPWRVDPTAMGRLILNEVHALSSPGIDSVELFNASNRTINLSGWYLTDNPSRPTKVPLTGTLGPQSYRQLSGHSVPNLSARGDSLLLYQGNTLEDSISWGFQLRDYSLGRAGPTSRWTLTEPTPGTANRAAGLAPTRNLRINEWLAAPEVRYGTEYVEIYNPGDSPAALGGLWLSDSPDRPLSYRLPAHTYVAPGGFAVFHPTGDPTPDTDELPFTLNGFQEWLVLSAPEGGTIDQVAVTCQLADIVEGRNPDGSPNIETLPLGTQGRSNNRAGPVQKITTLLPFRTPGWSFLDNDDPPSNWTLPDFDDQNWEVGPAPLGRETSILAIPLATNDQSDPAFDYSRSRKNYYFRRTFRFDGNPSLTRLTLETLLDDGAIFYLNGRELYRHNMPSGPLGSGTWAQETIDNAVFEGPLPVPSENLVSGTNTLAVVTYQAAPSSSDIVFACELTASESIVAPPDPAESVLQSLLDNLRITEVMYNPPDGNDGEFIEVRNISDTVTLNLEGIRFTEGVEFEFPALDLDPGAHIVIVKNRNFFERIHGAGINIAGEFDDSKLDNSSETIALTLPEPWDVDIQRFTYLDDWYPSTDASGNSLELRDPRRPLESWNHPSAWTASFGLFGSPGRTNAAAAFATWAEALGVGPGDPDGDLLAAPFEYAYGFDPLEAQFVPILLGQEAGPGAFSTFTYHIPAVAPEDVIFRLQSSPDLRSWVTHATREANGPWFGDGSFESIRSAQGLGLVRLRIPRARKAYTRILVEIAR